jgi:hypothetical protein
MPYYCRRSHGTGKRILWVLVVGVMAAVAVSSATYQRRQAPAPAPRPQPMGRMSAERMQEYAADSGIVAGAEAAQQALATRGGRAVPVNAVVSLPAESPPDRSGSVIRLRVRSEAPHATREKALADALILARLEITKRLGLLESPVWIAPSLEAVRNQYLRPESVRYEPVSQEARADLIANQLDPNQWYATVDVQVSEEQIRHLRAGQRLDSAWGVGMVSLVVVAALFGFLRLDAWTRGYLTTGLALSMAAVAGGAVALLFLVR